MSALTECAFEKDKSLCKPEPGVELVYSVLHQYWGIKPIKVSQLESYDDANFYIRESDSKEYLIKFYNAVETENNTLLEGYSSVLNHIDKHVNSINVPVPIPLAVVNDMTRERLGASLVKDVCFIDNCPVFGRTVEVIAVRLFVWVKGCTLNSWTTSKFPKEVPVDTSSVDYAEYMRLLGKLAEAIAELRVCLDAGYASSCHKEFGSPSHPAFMNRVFCWDIRQYDLVLPYFQHYNCEDVEEQQLLSICEDIYRCYRDELLPHESELDFGTIQGDCNDANVVVKVDAPGGVETVSIAGVIDFGDTIYSYAINEFLITVAYALLTPVGLQCPEAVFTTMITAYHKAVLKATGSSFSPAEIKYFRLLIALRLSTSVTIGHYSIIMNPQNREYLELHATPARKALKFIWVQKTDQDFYEIITRCML
jgi:Ser/Thr protein kinase RdoA (MazF antagonist)